ncbi:hypothetical protein ROJ8625_04098 [Roseivivax jejudonensis]|uniref:Uncharacterized protein n=1 Tax=Roseivivax jejudonensis TaxID=1529041 RepID=A0A1X7AAU9_9RHOB|nr:hypothetical protein [Roseivivax jejudonensis]SLN74769.1 hypothetical protein ROJ8625_04098 [Roseivivax jejudonensis]
MSEEALTPALAEQSPAPEAVQEAPQQEAPQEADEQQEPQEKPKRSRREALEKAFSDLDEEAEGEKAKKPDVKKYESKKEAEQKPAEAKTEQQRGPDGKFVAKDDKPEAKAEPKAADSFNEAPSRFSADAKAEWANAPQAIKAEAHRAVREMEQGIEQYRQRIEPLEPFYKMAEQQGVKLEDALGRYINLENMLSRDPVAGFSEIARNMGMSPQQIGQMLTGQQPGQSDPRDKEIQQLRQQVKELRQGFGGVQQTMQQQQEQAVHKQIEDFAAQNPRFEELSGEIATMLSTGYAKDLQEAYEKAERMNPPAPQPQAAPETPAQTREVKSVTGAPTAGSNPAQRKPSANREEAIARAMRSAGF